MRTPCHYLLLPILGIPLLFSSCIESAYFHSPAQGNSFSYHAMPVGTDSVKSATYVGASAAVGNMNSDYRDLVYSFQAAVHQGHALGMWRLNYGAMASLGSYNVASYYVFGDHNGGNKFFGTYGAYAGLSMSVPIRHRGEWRVIGLEGSLVNEFGDYLSYRKGLPDSAANEIDRHRYLGSLGLNTEFVFKGRSGKKFGIKIAGGSFLRRLDDRFPGTSTYPHRHDDLLYFSNTYHFTFNRTTPYFQFNVATHAFHFQLGCQFRL